MPGITAQFCRNRNCPNGRYTIPSDRDPIPHRFRIGDLVEGLSENWTVDGITPWFPAQILATGFLLDGEPTWRVLFEGEDESEDYPERDLRWPNGNVVLSSPPYDPSIFFHVTPDSSDQEEPRSETSGDPIHVDVLLSPEPFPDGFIFQKGERILFSRKSRWQQGEITKVCPKTVKVICDGTSHLIRFKHAFPIPHSTPLARNHDQFVESDSEWDAPENNHSPPVDNTTTLNGKHTCPCPGCPATRPQISALDAHINNSHAPAWLPPFPWLSQNKQQLCPLCQKAVISLSNHLGCRTCKSSPAVPVQLPGLDTPSPTYSITLDGNPHRAPTKPSSPPLHEPKISSSCC